MLPIQSPSLTTEWKAVLAPTLVVIITWHVNTCTLQTEPILICSCQSSRVRSLLLVNSHLYQHTVPVCQLVEPVANDVIIHPISPELEQVPPIYDQSPRNMAVFDIYSRFERVIENLKASQRVASEKNLTEQQLDMLLQAEEAFSNLKSSLLPT